jgi:hypothetical protein
MNRLRQREIIRTTLGDLIAAVKHFWMMGTLIAFTTECSFSSRSQVFRAMAALSIFAERHTIKTNRQ